MKGDKIEIKQQKIIVSFSSIENFDGKYYNVQIPSFGIYFSTSEQSKIMSISLSMVKSFFSHREGDNKSQKRLFIDLHKLGFRTHDHNLFMKNILNHSSPLNDTILNGRAYNESTEKRIEYSLETIAA